MGPRRERFWLPLARLCAFFAVVVAAGNVVLHAFRPPPPEHPSGPDESADYYARKKRRLERQIYRTIELFWGPAHGPGRYKVGEAPEPGPVSSVLCVVPAAEPSPDEPPIAAPSPRSAPPLEPAVLAYLEPEPAGFVWPEPLKPAAFRPVDLPLSLGLEDAGALRRAQVTEFYRWGAADPLADFGDVVLRGPELLVDGVITCANGIGSRPPTRVWDDDQEQSLASRLLDVQIGARTDRIWSEFMNQFTDREMSYLGNFGDSRVDTFQFEDRTEAADNRELMLDQRKVFWDALRRTYLSRYKVQADERLRDQAWYFDRWSGADFLVVPPLLGGYVFYRGLDRRFSIGTTRLIISVEPVSEWYRSSKHDLPAALAMEWTMKNCPVGVIVSAGHHEGRFGMDFMGVGTSLGAVRRALVMQDQPAERW